VVALPTPRYDERVLGAELQRLDFHPQGVGQGDLD
jgi:hypothetical protein